MLHIQMETLEGGLMIKKRQVSVCSRWQKSRAANNLMLRLSEVAISSLILISVISIGQAQDLGQANSLEMLPIGPQVLTPTHFKSGPLSQRELERAQLNRLLVRQLSKLSRLKSLASSSNDLQIAVHLNTNKLQMRPQKIVSASESDRLQGSNPAPSKTSTLILITMDNSSGNGPSANEPFVGRQQAAKATVQAGNLMSVTSTNLHQPNSQAPKRSSEAQLSRVVDLEKRLNLLSREPREINADAYDGRFNSNSAATFLFEERATPSEQDTSKNTYDSTTPTTGANETDLHESNNGLLAGFANMEEYLNLDELEEDQFIDCTSLSPSIFRRDQLNMLNREQIDALNFTGSRRQLFICVERRYRIMNFITSIITPILFTIIILVGLIGNIAVILVIWEDRKQERELSPPNLLILDLSLADLSFILFCIPFTGWDYAVGHWIFGDTWCKLNQYLIVVCALSSIYTLVLMSVDRFLAVVYPIECIRIRTSRNTLYAILVKWIIILLMSTPSARMHGEIRIYDDGNWQCRFLMNDFNAIHFQIIFFLASYLLPLSLIGVLYWALLNKLWYGNKPVGHRESTKMLESKKKVTVLVAGIVIVFAICWFPIQMMLIMMRLQIHEITINYVALQVFAHILGYMNSCVNPIVYAFASENFNNSFKRSNLGRLYRAATPWLHHVDPHDLHTRGGGQSNSNIRPMHNSHSRSNNISNQNHIFTSKPKGNKLRGHNNNSSNVHEPSPPTIQTVVGPTKPNVVQSSPSSGQTQTSSVTESYPLNQIHMRQIPSGQSSDLKHASQSSQNIIKLEPRDRCQFKLQQVNSLIKSTSDQTGSAISTNKSNVIQQQHQESNSLQQAKQSIGDCDQQASSIGNGNLAASVKMPKQQLVAQVSHFDSRSISHRCEPMQQQI